MVAVKIFVIIAALSEMPRYLKYQVQAKCTLLYITVEDLGGLATLIL
jgi:hypothetical protein